MLHFIDFEVFYQDWLCVIVDLFGKSETIIVNDQEKMQKYYDEHKNEIFVGYNIREYDQFILKAILLGINPKEVNNKIIIKGKKGHEVSSLFSKIPLLFFDVKTNFHGLKTLEAFMGHNIHETSVDFNIKRKLTPEEIELTVKYCKNDVYETIEVFKKRFSEFEAISSLIKTFDLPLNYISKTKPQLSAIILDCTRTQRYDEWDLSTVPTIKLGKYSYIKDWFLSENNQDYEKSLIVDVAGVEHTFAWGGLHGAKTKYHSKTEQNGKRRLIFHVDVESFYPALMIVYSLLSRNVKDPKKYEMIRDKRLEYKHAFSKLQGPFKIVLNATYGMSKDKYSAAYDPRSANLVCVNGQLLLLDLIEKLEVIPDFTLIQSNTDGLIVEIPEEYETLLRKICQEWMDRTKMGLAFDEIDEIWQKDVNNYIFHFKNTEKNGKKSDTYERKGAWVKENSELDNDLPILNECLFNYFTKGLSVEDTISSCTDFTKFQKVVKLSSKYDSAWHNNEKLSEKTFRVFASLDKNDGYIGKKKADKDTIEKFGNTPEHCFIWNESTIDVEIPQKLDLDYYINLAEERIQNYC